MDLTKLEPGETIEQNRRQQQLVLDCLKVAAEVERNPGLVSKREIAEMAGLDVDRVARCLRYINSNETPFQRIDYGRGTPLSGRNAGLTVQGWFPMKYARYQRVMDDADDHSDRTELGVRRSRLMRLAFAHGLPTKAAEEVIVRIEARLAVHVDTLSQADFEAFEDLLAQELALEGD